MLAVQRGNETYHVDELTGNISRPAIGMKASGQWYIVEFVRLNNLGNIVDRMPVGVFAEYLRKSRLPGSLSYKNGKPKWTVLDVDHGTVRQWGNGIRNAYIV